MRLDRPLAVVVLAASVVACGGGGAGEGGDEFVTLTVPEGWVASDSGLKVAEEESDLRTDDPDGAVIRVDIGEPVNTDYVGMAEAAFTDPQAVEFGVLEDLTVDGYPASGVAIRSDGRVVQHLAVHPPGTEGAIIVLDAPEGRYEALRETLQDAVEITT